jgi:hypothetical protein
MKCKIYVSGQPSGNSILKSAIMGSTSVMLQGELFCENGAFSSYTMHFDSVTDAKNSIKEAYNYLKNSGRELPWRFSKSRDNHHINYDASSATLIKTNKK